MQRDVAAIWRLAAVRTAMASRGALVAAIALGVFAALLTAAGKDPFRAYLDTLVYVFGNAYGFSELLVRMIPLLLTAVAVALPTRIGLINQCGRRRPALHGSMARDRGRARPVRSAGHHPASDSDRARIRW